MNTEIKRNGIEIRVWMLRKGVKQRDIEKATGLSQPMVSRTISGECNCQPVLDFFLKNGCPRKHLALPGTMSEAV
jgi:predicted XRE-type DNA-binding protein